MLIIEQPSQSGFVLPFWNVLVQPLLHLQSVCHLVVSLMRMMKIMKMMIMSLFFSLFLSYSPLELSFLKFQPLLLPYLQEKKSNKLNRLNDKRIASYLLRFTGKTLTLGFFLVVNSDSCCVLFAYHICSVVCSNNLYLSLGTRH